ncbi:ABC transporter ATP-binding protein [Spirochaeta africana]|uniref:ABC-type multidrug transport system, ATPase and permease component n=1 Tax=Spirochaeta africana (strain ATCC 700263 / DSM 8902 / Z-7692) TaxID=889378 RepID=H9UL40_SPIAZ|nr:ABC transporter ATP-binding protein [Spirochaeta africana]AFG38233.1 ABC-type multidrug transport system, ATPase and permease component [Spirochaeta africana DSM 8902]
MQLKVLLVAMRGSRRTYLAGLAALAVATIFLFLGPQILRITLDSVLANEPPRLPEPLLGYWSNLGGRTFFLHRLWLPAAALAATAILQGLFTCVQGRATARSSEAAVERLRTAMYNHIQRLPYLDMDRFSTGDLIQRCTSDIDTIRRFISLEAPEIVRTLAMLSIAVPMMLSMDPALTVLGLALVPVLFGFSLLFFLRVQRAFERMDESEARMSTMLQESITGIRVVRAFGRQRYEEDRFSQHNEEFRHLTFGVINNMALYWSVSSWMSMLQVGLLLVGGSILVLQGSVSIGVLTAFLTIQTHLLFPVRMLGRVLANMGQMSVALGRLQEVLRVPIEQQLDEGQRPEVRGGLSLQNVEFSYPDGSQVLHGINCEIHPGERIGILGPTGSGKSTLVHLLARLFEYSGGSIRIDGVELNTIAKRHLRSQVAVVLQEPFLFARTIRENLRLARAGARDEEIIEAARTACFHEVVNGFSQGYDTMVGERGVTLSGGQKQRLALARTLLRDTPVLILDDAMSAVDTETEAEIRQALESRRDRLTTIMVSHRITTLAATDRILVMDDGRIVDSGRHEELINRPGLYQRVWQLQHQFALQEEAAG